MTVRAVVTMEKVSGISRDSVQNVLHFASKAGAQDYAGLFAAIQNLYNGEAGGTMPGSERPSYYLSLELSRSTNAHRIEFYLLDSGTGAAGVIQYSGTWTLREESATPLTCYPSEVACCISLSANADLYPEEAPGGTRPASRRRGRVYVGPFNTRAGSYNANTKEFVFATGLLNSLKERASDLRAAATTLEHPWGVYSRTDLQTRAISGGWVDSAPDIQRRRETNEDYRLEWT
jgi:hypothetical protein